MEHVYIAMEHVNIAMEHVESLTWTSHGRDRVECCILGRGALQIDRQDKAASIVSVDDHPRKQ
jgi:hypothetical protein